MARQRSSVAALLVFALLAWAAPSKAMRVLWLGDDGKPDARAKPKGSAAPESTDRLLQEAIWNIDQLTNVARSLSKDQIAAQAAAGAQQAAARECTFTFSVKHDKTQHGDKVLVIGNHPSLGAWDVSKALDLKTSSSTFPVWSTAVKLAPGQNVEFKFITESTGGKVEWEKGPNRKITVPSSAGATMKSEFDKSGERISETGSSVAAAHPAASGGGGAVALRPAHDSSGTAKLHLRVKCETKPGDSVRVCGWLPQMGGWKPEKAAYMKTNKDEYPYWSVSLDVPISDVQETIKYKYLVVNGNKAQWEDRIADRTLDAERRAGGVLAVNMHTHVDDGMFNELQRVCTYVRDTHERQASSKPLRSSSQTGGQLVVPNGMQLVSLEQVRQWEMRVAELEEECMSLKERAVTAETTVDALRMDLEEEKRQNEEIMAQMKFVEDLLERMKKIEVQVSELEQTKEVLITRSESLANIEDGPAGARSLSEGIEDGLAQAASILGSLDKQLPPPKDQSAEGTVIKGKSTVINSAHKQVVLPRPQSAVLG